MCCRRCQNEDPEAGCCGDEEGGCIRWFAEREWSWATRAAWILVLASVFAIAGAIVEEYTDDVRLGSFRVRRILYLSAVGVALYVPASLVNHLVFVVLSFLCVCTRSTRTFHFYSLSFDGPLSGMLTFAGAWVSSRVILNTRNATANDISWMDKTFGSLLAFSVLFGFRSLLLKVALSGVLQEAYENRMERLLKIQELAKILTQPNPRSAIADAPPTPTIAEEARTDKDKEGPQPLDPAFMGQSHTSPSHKESVPPAWTNPTEFHATLRRMERGFLRLYDEKGELHSIRKVERVRSIARQSFKRLFYATQAAKADIAPSPLPFSLAAFAAGAGQEGPPVPSSVPPVPSSVPPAPASIPPFSDVRDTRPPDAAGNGEAPRTRSPERMFSPRARRLSGSVPSGAGAGTGLLAHSRPTPVEAPESPRRDQPSSPASDGPPRRRGLLVDVGDDTGLRPPATIAVRVGTPRRPLGPRTKSFGHRIRVSDGSGWELPWTWARGLFGHTDSQRKQEEADQVHYLSKKEFEAFLKDSEDLKGLYSLFDQDEDGFVSSVEFEGGLVSCFEEWKGFRETLANHGYVTRAVRALANLIFGLVAGIVVLWIYQVSISDLFLPIGSVLLSFSFAFGGVLSQIVASFVFVAFTRAYDVGDRVSSFELMENETLIVASVDVLTTTFDRINGKRLIMPNWRLAQLPLENHRRAIKTSLQILLSVGRETSATKLSSIKDHIRSHLQARPTEWKSGVYFIVLDENQTNKGLVTLNIWVQCRFRWQEGGKVWNARSQLLTSIFTFMRENGIRYEQAPLPVQISFKEGEEGAEAAAAAASGALRRRNPAVEGGT